MAIHFYSTVSEWGWLSNFSRHGFQLNGQYWPTVEHYFQAQKFPGTHHAEAIRLAATPKQAKQLGRTRAIPLRPDWEAIKDDLMRLAVRSKFATHAELRTQLLQTGDEELIEAAPSDYYWGCGADGSGKNRLGQILMEVRAALRASA